MIRTRFEPAPSGSIHVGNGRTALFAWLWARQNDGAFILRVADTDASRARDEHIDSLIEMLHWLGLDWDEGPDVGGPHAPYRQSLRYDMYRKAADAMIASGRAYHCYCTPEELDLSRKQMMAAGKPPRYDRRCLSRTPEEKASLEAAGLKPAVRFFVPEGETVFEDLVRGEVRFRNEEISDFIIMRADRTPTYLLAAAYDDLHMEVTDIVRGEDLLSSTPRQIMLFDAMGASHFPKTAHLSLIVGSDRQPLSKRHGHTSLEFYRESGFLPEALMNYIALLGWSYGDGTTEKLSRSELIKHFSFEHVSRNPAAFDVPKLTAMNGDYIRELAPTDLADRLTPFLKDLNPDRELLLRIIPLIQERMQTLVEAPPMIRFFFSSVEPDESARSFLTPEYVTVLEHSLEALSKIEKWETDAIKEALFGVQESLGLKKKVAFMPVRAAVTGSKISPPLFESLEVLGRERSLERIRYGSEIAANS
ncbi:MAG: glutamate--tRNA ligase [Actinomycetota bacterium]